MKKYLIAILAILVVGLIIACNLTIDPFNYEKETSPPDLEMSTLTVSENVLLPGQDFNLSVTVYNKGEDKSSGSSLYFYQSSDSNIDASDTPVGTNAMPSLSGGGESEQTITLTAPNENGTYYYGACVDAVAGESDRSDNCSSSIEVVVASPDLEVLMPLATTTLTPGENFTLSIVVTNSGQGNAGGSTLTYYRSSDSSIADDDSSRGTDDVPALAGGEASEQNIPLTAPTTEGFYYYGGCVSVVDGESDASNNCSVGLRIEVVMPDLSVSARANPSTLLVSDTDFTLEVTINNDGSGGAGVARLLIIYPPTTPSIQMILLWGMRLYRV